MIVCGTKMISALLNLYFISCVEKQDPHVSLIYILLELMFSLGYFRYLIYRKFIKKVNLYMEWGKNLKNF
jgi:hypothetical protein